MCILLDIVIYVVYARFQTLFVRFQTLYGHYKLASTKPAPAGALVMRFWEITFYVFPYTLYAFWSICIRFGTGGTGSPVTGEPSGRNIVTHSLLEKVRTPSGKPGWGNM